MQKDNLMEMFLETQDDDSSNEDWSVGIIKIECLFDYN